MHMQTIHLDVSSDILDKVMAFIEILPKDKIKLNIENDSSASVPPQFDPRDFFGVAHSSIADIDSDIKAQRSEWDS